MLDGGNSARIAKHLIRDSQVAASAGAGYSLDSRLDALFLLDGTPSAGHSVKDVEEALRAQIERLQTDLVSPEELARVKAQVMASDVYQRDSSFYQAMKIGSLETVGLGWEVGEQYLEQIRAVTAEQVRDVARKYLVEDRLTVAVLDPLPITEVAQRRLPGAQGGGHGR